MTPPLLAEHVALLRERGENVEVVEEGSRHFVVVKDFQLPTGRYIPPSTDLMMMADYQYPQSRLDMFWTDPPVMLTSGATPQAADSFEYYIGRRWQRWSWHYDGWNPAIHNIITHLEVFKDRLARGT